jgi:hypothetical protein
VDPSTNTAGVVVDDADADDDDRAHEPAAAAKKRLAELLTPRIVVREVQRRTAVTRVTAATSTRSQTVGFQPRSFQPFQRSDQKREKGCDSSPRRSLGLVTSSIARDASGNDARDGGDDG